VLSEQIFHYANNANYRVLRKQENQDLSSGSEQNAKVAIPLELYNEIRDSIQGAGFSSVDDFVVYTLRVSMGKKKEVLPQEDEEKVTARLRALGYV
jgi:hypothetical protein